MSGYRSKSVATWLAVVSGAFGGQRLYLYGWRDTVAWLHPLPTALGLYGVWRMRTLGQDDTLATLLIPLLGVMLTIGMLSAIVIGLTPDERWDSRWNPGQPPRGTRWWPVLGAVAALMLGGGVLIGTIAFTGQRFFEWLQQPRASEARPGQATGSSG